MNKQTKQLLVLGALVLVGGVVLYFVYFSGGDDNPPPAKNNDTAEINTPAAPAGGGGPQPAGEQGPQPAGGSAPQTKVVDKEIPPDTRPPEIRYSWPWDPTPAEPPADYVAPFDPLFVQNIDVVDPERKQYIEALKSEWVLEGISETWQDIDIVDEQGTKIGTERKLIREAWFKGKKRPYKGGDRLTNTRFQIEEIFINHADGVSGCILLGDTGARVPMELAPATRFDDDK